MPHRVELPRVFNAADWFVDRPLREGHGERVVLRCRGASVRLRELAENVNRAGNALRALGVGMENRVLLLLDDGPEFAAAFFGAIKIGAVPVPVNTLLRTPEYEYFFNDSRARAAVVHRDPWVGIASVRSRLPHLEHVLVADPGGGPDSAFHELLARAPAELDPAPTSVDDAAFWLYSSGSTGFPKGAVHLQHDMVHCAEMYARGVLELGQEDVVLSAAKLFFAYGLGNSLYFPLHVGATAVLSPGRPRPDLMFELIARERPTVFFGVPTLYAAMLALPEARAPDTSSLRLCVSAGEPLPAELYHRWRRRFGIEILDGIGSTEALHIFLSNRSGAVKPGSTGTVVPGYDARITNDEGDPVAAGEIGNLFVKGESTFAGYWNQHARTRATIQGDWIATGDKYYQDADGYFWYCGRADDMLKAGGMWVSPIEVEATLIEHGAVLEAAVVGVEDRDGLVKPKAFVVLATGRTASTELEEDLRAFVKQRIASYKCPRWFEFVEELPKTATGKIQRFKLRAAAQPARADQGL
jgi:benzoate-CoA ligase